MPLLCDAHSVDNGKLGRRQGSKHTNAFIVSLVISVSLEQNVPDKLLYGEKRLKLFGLEGQGNGASIS